MALAMIRLLFVLLFINCDSPTSSLNETSSILSSATSEVIISDYSFTLSANLWRDFQPISPPNGKPLILVADIVESNGKNIPSSIQVDSVKVINGDQVWSGILSVEKNSTAPPNTRQMEIRDGPKWGPGIYVDLVVRLIDREQNIHWLKEQNLLIERTD